MTRFFSAIRFGALLGAACLTASADIKASSFPDSNFDSRRLNADAAHYSPDQQTGLSGPDSPPQYVPARKGAPASSAVRAGNVLYLSGLLGSGPDGRIVGDVSAQTHAVMGRLRDVLARNGSSLGHVLQCTVIVTDIQTLPEVNAVYIQYFPEGRLPARTAFEASRLAANALVEIECKAYVNQTELRS
ncbi:RidA family protein [Pseudomonas sp. LT1P18]|uniref:RidA family protein n=1 Tax=Pseudomonas arabinosi TaxID=3398357 RepID=UPI0039F0FD84